MSTISSIRSRLPFGKSSQTTSDETPQQESQVWKLTKWYANKFWQWFKTDNWKWVMAMFIIAGITHILIVLFIPSFAPKSAWMRIESQTPLNKMVILTKSNRKKIQVPLLAPDISYAICRYDLSNGAIKIKTQIPNDLFSVAAYDHLGQNYYIISGEALQRDALYMVITLDKNVSETEVNEAEKADDIDDVVVVNATDPKGVIVLRAPIVGPAYERLVSNVLKGASCQTN